MREIGCRHGKGGSTSPTRVCTNHRAVKAQFRFLGRDTHKKRVRHRSDSCFLDPNNLSPPLEQPLPPTPLPNRHSTPRRAFWSRSWRCFSRSFRLALAGHFDFAAAHGSLGSGSERLVVVASSIPNFTATTSDTSTREHQLQRRHLS